MAWLEIEWDLNPFRENERDDESGLHFAIVTVIDGEANVHGHRTGDLSQLPAIRTTVALESVFLPGYWGRIRSQRHVPSADNPYIGLVVRAVEYDNSDADDRATDYEQFIDRILFVTKEAVGMGGLPGPQTLWAAGHFHDLIDNFGDDDDRLGVSARVDPTWGTRIAPAVATEDDVEVGTPLGGYGYQSMRFVDQSADYRFTFNWKMRAGDPGTIPWTITQQHRGAAPGGPRDL